ncbi:hypothetical protein A0H76_2898 [Hepatospora eriocheir]|uniref:Uncharacterized protein n=1 Tax=Hepatospora eriocheir TaxID=1081669 RepID=A0A1X0Q5L6_9MICR|nr:hypothetical protein A0H76_2898 [Hepatospora eriocheir]
MKFNLFLEIKYINASIDYQLNNEEGFEMENIFCSESNCTSKSNLFDSLIKYRRLIYSKENTCKCESSLIGLDEESKECFNIVFKDESTVNTQKKDNVNTQKKENVNTQKKNNVNTQKKEKLPSFIDTFYLKKTNFNQTNVNNRNEDKKLLIQESDKNFKFKKLTLNDYKSLVPLNFEKKKISSLKKVIGKLLLRTIEAKPSVKFYDKLYANINRENSNLMILNKDYMSIKKDKDKLSIYEHTLVKFVVKLIKIHNKKDIIRELDLVNLIIRILNDSMKFTKFYFKLKELKKLKKDNEDRIKKLTSDLISILKNICEPK